MTSGTDATGGAGTNDASDPSLTGLSWLALEVKYLEPAREFYEETLGLSTREFPPAGIDETCAQTDSGTALGFAAGETTLALRRPTGSPRGGIHTHYALSIPADEYDDWWSRLENAGYELAEVTFGSARSLYLYDPDGNCVELGQRAVTGPGVDGLFEVALEVEDLDRSTTFYAALGFETVDRGEARRRVRMQGPMALELWEPQLGIADARGGVHVDIGFESPDPDTAATAVEESACSVASADDHAVIRDPDGHHLTIHPPR